VSDSNHPGFVLRRLRNASGVPFKFPVAMVELEHGDEADIVYVAHAPAKRILSISIDIVPAEGNGSASTASTANDSPSA